MDLFPTEWDNSEFEKEENFEGTIEEPIANEPMRNLEPDSQSDSESDWESVREEEEEPLRFGRENDGSPLRGIPFPGWHRHQQTECKVPLSAGKTAKDFLYMILPRTLVSDWVNYSNKNMDLFFEGKEGPRKVYGKSCPRIKGRELLAILGIFLIMGCAHIDSLRDAYK